MKANLPTPGCAWRIRRSLRLCLLAAALATSVSHVFCAPDPAKLAASGTTKSGWSWREVRLGTLPAEEKAWGTPIIDDHGWHYGLVVHEAEGEHLWLDGADKPAFGRLCDSGTMDAGLIYAYRFSYDGKRLAYPVEQADGKIRMVVDDHPGSLEEEAKLPKFSPDGQRLAYVVKRKGRSHLLLDGVAGPACDEIHDITFSPDSKRIAYVVQRGTNSNLMVDGVEHTDWPGGGWPEFSANSKRIAYSSEFGIAVVDGVIMDVRKKANMNSIWSSYGPIFSLDSRHVYYEVSSRDPSRSAAFVDGNPLALPNDGKDCGNIDLDPQFKHWAYALRTPPKYIVVIDGKPGPSYKDVWGLEFSPSGSRLMYVAQVQNEWHFVVDGKIGDEIALNWYRPCFSTDGKRFAYTAGKGSEWWMVVDGKAGPHFKGTQVHSGPLSIERGMIEVPAFTKTQFSPDSRHVAYGTLQGGQWRFLLDDVQIGGVFDKLIFNEVHIGGDYDKNILNGPSFHGDGSLEFLGLRQRVLYRVTAKPQGKSAENGD